ncbi:hypothetical protein ACFQL7_17275 [Halocatena marina]|uniref:Uncharacterized protein n=1 Tax=Halocatena marina TaxID=2934937 RepID=A0ABD5YQ04_9EURY
MGLSAVSYTLVFGDRPQTSVQALVAGLVVVGCAVVMRFVAPSLLLGIEPALLTAAIGFLLAVAVGRYEGGVLVAILAAVIPVFSVAVASTAILAPVTPELAARAMRGALWYSMGVAVFVTGLPGYAVGRISQSDHAFSSLLSTNTFVSITDTPSHCSFMVFSWLASSWLGRYSLCLCCPRRLLLHQCPLVLGSSRLSSSAIGRKAHLHQLVRAPSASALASDCSHRMRFLLRAVVPPSCLLA